MTNKFLKEIKEKKEEIEKMLILSKALSSSFIGHNAYNPPLGPTGPIGQIGPVGQIGPPSAYDVEKDFSVLNKKNPTKKYRSIFEDWEPSINVK